MDPRPKFRNTLLETSSVTTTMKFINYALPQVEQINIHGCLFLT